MAQKRRMPRAGLAIAFSLAALTITSCGRFVIVPSPNPTDPSATMNSDILSQVSCPTPSFCVAVGTLTTDYGATQGMIESGTGASLKAVSSPVTKQGTLRGVSCVSATFCMAVGWYNPTDGEQPLSEMWDGTAWSIIPTPPTQLVTNGSGLNAVSCSSATSCVAVGGGLIESWNGSIWSLSANPDTSDAMLFGVSCTSPKACVVVGNSIVSGTHTVIESLAAGIWSVMPSPNAPNVSSNNFLNAVSCVTSAYCVAVGQYNAPPVVNGPPIVNGQNLTEVLSGGHWSILPSPNASNFDGLSGVSCVAVSICLAAGQESVGGAQPAEQTLIEVDLGGSWTIHQSANTSTNWENYLQGISCPSVTSCVAVGSTYETGPGAETLVETLDPLATPSS